MNKTYQTIKVETDVTTGELTEVTRTYSSTPFTAPDDSYQNLATAQEPVQPHWSPEHTKDALRLLEAANDSSEAPQKAIEHLPERKDNRGRKRSSYFNTIALHVMLADLQGNEDQSDSLPPQNWVEDYIMGACYVVAGASKGILNVSPRHVYGACKMEMISTETIMTAANVEDRQARRIAQCARYALKGMQMHLNRHPALMRALSTEVEFIREASESFKLEFAA